MKKFISILLAGVISVISIIPNVCFATDPNGDGFYQLNDVFLIRQYISGNTLVSNLTALDYNQNGIVSEVDALKYQSDLLYNQVDTSNPSLNDNTTVSEHIFNETSRNYSIYEADTGALRYMSSYSINCCNTCFDNGDPPNSVVGGSDDRVVDFSKSAVVKIIVTKNSGTGYGTGFIVGPHTIATAAHVLDDPSRYMGIGRIDHIYSFNTDGSLRTDTITPLEMHLPSKYTSPSNNEEDYYDYALIKVQEDLSNYPFFEFGVYDYMSDRDITAQITGFPAVVNNINVNNVSTSHVMYTGTNTVLSSDGGKINHNIDTSPGNSGGPLYITEYYDNKVRYIAIGIHNLGDYDNNGTNHSVQINTDIIKFFNYNSQSSNSSGGATI